jgi:hypothetical protein
MKKSKLVFVHDNSGDWAGMYIDGKLVTEGHSLPYNEVLNFLDIKYEERWIDMEKSRLPENEPC